MWRLLSIRCPFSRSVCARAGDAEGGGRGEEEAGEEIKRQRAGESGRERVCYGEGESVLWRMNPECTSNVHKVGRATGIILDSSSRAAWAPKSPSLPPPRLEHPRPLQPQHQVFACPRTLLIYIQIYRCMCVCVCVW
jgi:hypothetical protein